MLRAPWTPEQVEHLERYQDSLTAHPYTCDCGAWLVPRVMGWTCPCCDYTQDWCHAAHAAPEEYRLTAGSLRELSKCLSTTYESETSVVVEVDQYLSDTLDELTSAEQKFRREGGAGMIDLFWAFRKTDPALYKQWAKRDVPAHRQESVNLGSQEDIRKWAARLCLIWWPALLIALAVYAYL